VKRPQDDLRKGADGVGGAKQPRVRGHAPRAAAFLSTRRTASARATIESVGAIRS
jgi:hypothetical protein